VSDDRETAAVFEATRKKREVQKALNARANDAITGIYAAIDRGDKWALKYWLRELEYVIEDEDEERDKR